MKKYPFKFLDSYNSEDRGIFFGRDEEVDALYEMVFQSSIILIYGASGTGKTSLINCGLADKFQPHDWLALMIRRGNNINDSLEKALNDAGGKTATSTKGINWLDEWSDETETKTAVLSPVVKSINAVYEKSFTPIYLIFDQFEELFILGSEPEQKLFIKNVQDILQSEQPVKLIFSIREEYLAELSEFERAVPQLLRKKLRIEPMNLEKVKQVIIGAAGYEDSNISIKPGDSDLVAQGIFDKIKGGKKSLTIQLPFLQVFLDKFYLKISGDKNRKLEAEFSTKVLNEMGEIGDILSNFLEEQVVGISKQLKGKYTSLNEELIWKILSPFSTPEGTKKPIGKQDLHEDLPDLNAAMIDDVVYAFINSRILRYNEATDMFELAHDSLAKPIAERRSVEEIALLEIKRLIESQAALPQEFREDLTEKQLNFIEPYYNKVASKLSEDEKKLYEDSKKVIDNKRKEEEKKEHRKKVKVILVLAIIFTGISGVLLYAIFLVNVDSMKNEFRSDVKPIENYIDSVNSKLLLASFNLEIDPTLAFQLGEEALCILDSARLNNTDTLRNKTYGFVSRFKKVSRFKDIEFKKLDSIYYLADSLIKVQTQFIINKNDAFYNKVKPEKPDNLKDTIINKFAVNRIFSDTIDSSFKVWHAEKHIIDTLNDIKSHGTLSQIVFPKDSINSNRAMVLYKNGTAGYLDSLGGYKPVQLDLLRHFKPFKDTNRITAIAPITYKKIRYKMLSAMNNNRLVEWNLNGTIRKNNVWDSTAQKNTIKPVIYYLKEMHLKENIISIAMSSGRTKIFTASDKGIGIIWEADTSLVKLDTINYKSFSLKQDTIVSSAFSNNGSMIVTGSKDNKVKIWNAENGDFIKELKGHTKPVTSVAFSANDSIVYTGSLDQTYRQWHLPAVDSISELSKVQWIDSLYIRKIINVEPCDSIKNKTSSTASQ